MILYFPTNKGKKQNEGFGVIVSTFGVIVSTFGVIVSTFGVIVSTFGVIVSTFGVIVSTFGVPASVGTKLFMLAVLQPLSAPWQPSALQAPSSAVENLTPKKGSYDSGLASWHQSFPNHTLQ